MAKRNYVVAALTSSILALCDGPALSAPPTMQPLDATTRHNIDGAVQQMMSEITSDLAQLGPPAWLRYFDEDAGFLMAVDGKLQFDGIASAKNFLNAFATTISHVELSWAEVKVDPLASGLASVGAAYSEVLTDTQGHANRLHGYFTGVVIQTPHGWKLRSAHWSSSQATR